MTRTLPFGALALSLGLLVCQAAPVRGNRAATAPDRTRLPLLYGEPAAKPKGTAPDGAESPGQTIRRLQRAYDDAQGKLDKDDAGSATQEVQKSIVRDLDKLINQPPPPSNPAPTQPPAGNPAPMQPAPPAPAGNVQPQPGHAPAPPAGKAPQPPAAKHPGKVPAKLGWSVDLPLRERLSVETFAQDHCLPQYEEILRRYYRAIADEASHKAP